MTAPTSPDLVRIAPDDTLWERVLLPSPLVVVGTREVDGGHDLAPKHMAMPLGFDGHFGFVCTPRHRTWANIERTGEFTVSWPRAEQVIAASLAASPRTGAGDKAVLVGLPVLPAQEVDGVLLEGALFHIECRLDRFVRGFGDHGLVVGRAVAAWAPAAALRGDDIEDADLVASNPVLVYLHPSRFAEVFLTQGFPFPAGFQR